MGQQIDFLAKYQSATKRDYVARVIEHDKAECATVAKRWGEEYWDGPRQYGYGGYKYDGRWLPIAQDIASRYRLKAGDKILDVGCGKAFLLYEFTRAVSGVEIAGLDISAYGIAHSKEETRPFLMEGSCTKLPYPDQSFDFVYSINTFHNLKADELKAALQEVERVGRNRKWICVESYRNEREKVNLLYWQLTCMSFYTPEEWAWLYRQWGYTGDYGFIFFE
jgi:protein-L-isoaspartate(D-aspartate) O-methyltransferase